MTRKKTACMPTWSSAATAMWKSCTVEAGFSRMLCSAARMLHQDTCSVELSFTSDARAPAMLANPPLAAPPAPKLEAPPRPPYSCTPHRQLGPVGGGRVRVGAGVGAEVVVRQAAFT